VKKWSELPLKKWFGLAKIAEIGDHDIGLRKLLENMVMMSTCQQRHVLDDGEPDPPLGVLGQLDDGRKQRQRQLLHSDHLADAILASKFGVNFFSPKMVENAFFLFSSQQRYLLR
jgi:hypothetical protein